MALRAVVVGGGIGGIAAAVALVRAGIDVRVYEQAQQLAEVGAGVSLAPNGLRMLDRLGVGDEIARVGARYVSAELRWPDGRAVPHEPHQFTRPGQNVGIHRADLLALLAGRLPPGIVRTGHRCTGFSQDAGRATVGFADGTTATADVLIGADGIHSVLQGFVVAPAKPVFSGVVAYRGLVPRQVHPVAQRVTVRTVMGRSGAHFPGSGHLGEGGRVACGAAGPFPPAGLASGSARVAGMLVGVIGALVVELHFPACRSLKEKRALLRPVIDGARARFAVAVAESDYQDLHQRSLVEVAAAASNFSPEVAALMPNSPCSPGL